MFIIGHQVPGEISTNLNSAQTLLNLTFTDNYIFNLYTPVRVWKLSGVQEPLKSVLWQNNAVALEKEKTLLPFLVR